MCFSSQILRITTDSGGNLNCLERFVQIPPEESLGSSCKALWRVFLGKIMFRNCWNGVTKFTGFDEVSSVDTRGNVVGRF